MKLLLALSLLLPLQAFAAAPSSFTLTSVDGGTIIKTEGCPKDDTRVCWAILLYGAKGKDAAGAPTAVGDLLFEGAASMQEAIRGVELIAVALGRSKEPGLTVELLPVRYLPDTFPLSRRVRMPQDDRQVRSARIVFTTSKGGVSQTFGIGILD
jgi:hypothetical protein